MRYSDLLVVYLALMVSVAATFGITLAACADFVPTAHTQSATKFNLAFVYTAGSIVVGGLGVLTYLECRTRAPR